MMETAKTPKGIIQATLQGHGTCRVPAGPLAVHYCANIAGVSIRDYTTDARVLADCVLRYYERFQPDAIWLSADTWVSAEAMGATVAFPTGNQPMGGTGAPCVITAEDIDRIPIPDPSSQGRYPMMLEALDLIKTAVGNDAFVVACFDQYPFSLACALMGIEHVMVKLFDDRPIVEALMERGLEYTLAYAKALADAGADMLSGGDSPAGLIGPALYQEIALPFEQRLTAAIKEHTTAPVSLHICGNATHILSSMGTSGADVLELDHLTDLNEACEVLGPDIAIWGNLDPVGVLAQGTVDEVRYATREALEIVRQHGHRRFVLSSGCALALETPPENLRAMLDTAKEFGVSWEDSQAIRESNLTTRKGDSLS